jgi:hypothetical protein
VANDTESEVTIRKVEDTVQQIALVLDEADRTFGRATMLTALVFALARLLYGLDQIRPGTAIAFLNQLEAAYMLRGTFNNPGGPDEQPRQR